MTLHYGSPVQLSDHNKSLKGTVLQQLSAMSSSDSVSFKAYPFIDLPALQLIKLTRMPFVRQYMGGKCNYSYLRAPPPSGFVLIWAWIIFTVIEAVCFGLMALKAYHVFKESRILGTKDLLRTILHDGIIYYSVIFVLSFLNVMVIATQPSGLDLLITLPIRVIHSVVASRIILRIRQPGAREPGDAFRQESRPPLSGIGIYE
ncbi:hypothetical protein BJ138DRAFT_1107287 [Hygrophoropsis aurantiaca]|uniref:Uncharacterized protein n=1 Tax=Hygrophoropsis aurantiaca TaxID=72124 RepID=A0ACB7ZSW6_9AGAM|nr:hypothetical protein BJ138DRAFT_1107287 [Hygrophoropsis aurantiaca]